MAHSCGLKMRYFSLIVLNYYIVLSLFLNNNLVETKNLDHNHHHHMENEKISCEKVIDYFDTINVTIDTKFDNKNGDICGGQCCDNTTEEKLMKTSTKNFEQLLRHHTRGLRGILEQTANTFREHVIELSRHSENKTLNLFTQVYRRMSPLSRNPILELYENIRSPMSKTYYTDSSENFVNNFFVNLFPVAYHHAVHHSDSENVDFHIDYKNCLMHTYDELQPFGEVPKILSKNLVQSISAATVFVRALDRAAFVLASTEDLDSELLTPKCKTHLLKMSYCPDCNGYSKHSVKCFGYCMNVMRGCISQYVGTLDSPWTSFAESIERLLTLVRSKDGIEFVIKTLDVKLSEAIMYAMENGPELEKKVKKACGTPHHLATELLINDDDMRQIQSVSSKWPSLPPPQMLDFLVTIDKSKDFYAKMVDSLCDDEEYKRDDRNCWIGNKFGEYTQSVMSAATQRYNPEVPYEIQHNHPRATVLNELRDKLINLRQHVANAITSLSAHTEIDNMQSDMAEGSGAWTDDVTDDSDYYGSGSGDGHKRIINPSDEKPTPTVAGPNVNRSATCRISIILINLTTIITCYLLTLSSTRH